MITEKDIRFPDIPFGKTAVLIVIGLALYFGYLYVVGFESVWDVLMRANYWYMALAIVAALAANAFHTAGWWVYLRNLGMRRRSSRRTRCTSRPYSSSTSCPRWQ